MNKKHFEGLLTGVRQMDRHMRGKPMTATRAKKKTSKFAKDVGLALREAALVARKTARMHGTPIYVWENGKVVAKKP